MAAGKSGQTSRFFVWILMGLLILGLVGFGATNFSGSRQTLASVGTAEVNANSYARALNQEIQAFEQNINTQISVQQALEIGLDRNVLARLISNAALQHEAGRIGISTGDEELAQQVRQRPEFAGIDGNFDQDTYSFLLERSGLSANEFEESLRKDVSISIMQAALGAGVATPQTYETVLTRYIGERRTFSWAEVTPQDLAEPVAEPTEADLKSFYDAEPDAFLLPEIRKITYAWLTPEAVLADITVDEADLRAAYDERKDEFEQPERRLVERLVFADEASASKALADVTAGTIGFEELVKQRGLALEDIDMGDVTKADLGPAGEAIFALAEPGLVGPLNTTLGPALFRVNAILAASSTPFADVEEELRVEISGDRARRVVGDRITEFDDLLAGGATVEELAEEGGMTLGTLEWHEGMQEGIAAYESFAAQAAKTTTDDFPEVIELEDGGVFALRVDQIEPAAPEPFESAKDRVRTAWTAAETQKMLEAKANAMKAGLDKGERLSALGLPTSVETDAPRTVFLDNAPGSLVDEVFKLKSGESVVVSADGQVLLAQLDALQEASPGDADVAPLVDALSERATQSMARDILDAYARSIEDEAGISVDEQMRAAIHTQLR